MNDSRSRELSKLLAYALTVLFILFISTFNMPFILLAVVTLVVSIIIHKIIEYVYAYWFD